MNLIKSFTHALIRRKENFRLGVYRLREILDPRASRESRNPLVELTPKRARELYDLYRKGHYADVMLAWDALEEYDDILGTVIERRLSALQEMEGDVKIDAKATGSRPGMENLAKEQQQCLAEYYGRIVNMTEAIECLASSSFRGFGAVEPFADGRKIHLLPVDHWLLARPVRRGPWYYNADADSSCSRLEEIDRSKIIIRESARPINITAMFAICAKAHAVDGWDGFIDVFGNPAIFFEYPPGTTPERAREYDKLAEQVVGDGRGGYPSGGKFTMLETTAKGGDVFLQRCDWCNKQIVHRGTGGELTVLAESGTGTLGGNAHEETFRKIAAAEGASISECTNRQMSHRILDMKFPGQPHLAYWSLGYAEQDDTNDKIDSIVALAGAGYRADDQAVSEVLGIDVQTVIIPPAVLEATAEPSASIYNVNRGNDAVSDAPLTSEEIALAERLMNALPDASRIEQDAQALQLAIKAGLTGKTVNDSRYAGDPVATPLQNAGINTSETGEGNRIENDECRAKNPTDCRYHHPKGKQAAKGTTREQKDASPNKQWHKSRTHHTPEQQRQNMQRGIEWSMKNKSDLNDIGYRKELGRISIPYGIPGSPDMDWADGYGLSHIEDKHGEKAVKMIPHMLAYGQIDQHPQNPNKNVIRYKGHELYLTRKRQSDPKAKARHAWLVTNYDPQAPTRKRKK